jgi:hypothetical protein
MHHLAKITAVAIIFSSLTGCLTQRTVTQNGRTVSQEYKIKRPIKEALEE